MCVFCCLLVVVWCLSFGVSVALAVVVVFGVC